MPVQNELCGIRIEDFLSIWNFGVLFRKTYAVTLEPFKSPLAMGMVKAIVAETSFTPTKPGISAAVSGTGCGWH